MNLRQLAWGAVIAVTALALTTDGRAALAGTFGGHRPDLSRPVPIRTVAGHAACPTAGPITSGWGPRWGEFHDGVDIGAPRDAPIRAVLGGTVTFSAVADPGGFGQYVDIKNAAGTQRYGHMRTRLVHVGDHVTTGQVIARVGKEGSSTGYHLHLRIYPGAPTGRGVDPVPWLAAYHLRLPCGVAG